MAPPVATSVRDWQSFQSGRYMGEFTVPMRAGL